MAQDQAQSKPDSIVLETKTGSVMTSTGGAYETVAPGKQLVTGESMMLTDGAKATVVYYYDNGDRKCVERYAGPNTYVIDDRCTKAAWMTNGSPGKSALVIVGAMLLWLLAQGLGGMYGWDPRYAFLFDLAALAAFIWALVVTYQIWQRHKAAGRGN